ncbi:dethiobiotin synthase [Sulfuriferula nivalis]|uniref:ATP-dependent dethiobiotin synthetase BioD n=1 Tax=Sulfuriferula nivalis TaxID=2675298 RepID=A0A809S4S2_9PROT|nr:dethiobiotin synthase [Sulfuriferula nivalis]BBP02048.1 ATP-dependent dethiobiotin synthetase BioD [Sulfuriferula nivalis]
MSFFVTGTDTDVGKTLIASALLHAFAARGLRVMGMKPVAAGSVAGIWHDVVELEQASNIVAPLDVRNPYRFEPPVAPHLAAQQAGVVISTQVIQAAYRQLSVLADVVIVEGAGGFCVPLNDTESLADVAQQLGLPVILVVGMRLGCINHALLTVLAIQSRGLRLAGWVANCVNAGMPLLDENILAVQQRINAPLLGIIPHALNISAMQTARHLQVDKLCL